jgi:uncharacterized protein (DUF1330 family)
MAGVQTDVEALRDALKLMPENSPFVMVNLLRYKDQADYGERKDVPACTGRAAYYKGYSVPTFDVIRRLGGRVFYFGHIQIPVFAPREEKWDDVLFVQYPAFSAVVALVSSPEYQANLHHRDAALADTRVFATLSGTEIS